LQASIDNLAAGGGKTGGYLCGFCQPVGHALRAAPGAAETACRPAVRRGFGPAIS